MIAIVTGGTKGIGRQIIKDLLARDYYVLTNYARDVSAAQDAAQEFSTISNNFEIIKADQADDEQFGQFIDYCKEESRDGINCVVCNTGITARKSMMEISNSDWEQIMHVNLTSHFYLMRDLHKQIQHNSRIIFIGSLLGISPHAVSLPYGVSKSALHTLAKNLIKEFEDTGTTVNVIAPGYVETEFQKDKPIEIRQNILKKTAIKRFADVKEISAAVMFCIDNSYVNGSIIEVNGGYCFK